MFVMLCNIPDFNMEHSIFIFSIIAEHLTVSHCTHSEVFYSGESLGIICYLHVNVSLGLQNYQWKRSYGSSKSASIIKLLKRFYKTASLP